MNTSKSLLKRAKEDPRSEAWYVLSSIYDPLISGWIARFGVEESEVGDVTQEVMQTVVQELANFKHNGRIGAFRAWLKVIAINRCRRYWKNKQKQVPTFNPEHGIKMLNQLEDPSSDVADLWDTEHDDYVFKKILQLIRREFEPQAVNVFIRNTIENESPQAIAEDLGLTVGKIYKIKFRVMQRLKQVAEGLLDESKYDEQ